MLLVLAARANLRILPFAQLARHDTYADRLVLPLFRAAAVSWAAANYPAIETDLSAAQAGEAVEAALAEPAIAALLPSFLSPMLCRSASASRGAVWTALCAALGAGGTAAALRWDSAAIMCGVPVEEVLASKLWPKAKPRQVTQLWKEMKRDLLAGNEDWEVWTQWYEARLQGKASSEALDLARLMMKNDIWEQGQAVVNHEIKELIARQGIGRRRRKVRAGVLAASGVPALCPAALEPAWVAGKLILSRNAAESDHEPAVTEASFALLSAKMSALAGQAVWEPLMSKRSILCFRSVAARIPACAPPQHELFYLAHVKGFLEEHVRIVEGELSDVFMKSFAETIFHFDLLIRQFAKWRDFLTESERNPPAPPEAAAIPALAREMISVLREDEAQNLIDPAIPSALEVFQAPLLGDMTHGGQQIPGPGEASMMLLAKDLFLSIENIVKRIAEAALAAKKSPGLDGQTDLARQLVAQDSGRVHCWMARTLTKLETGTRPLGLQAKLGWLEPVAGALDLNAASASDLSPSAEMCDQDGKAP